MEYIRFAALAAIFFCPVASGAAQTAAELARPFEITTGFRYWYSDGRTSWNNDASGIPSGLPFPASNPTSILTYDDLDAHTGEVFADLRHYSCWYVRAMGGGGIIESGFLDDEDYLVIFGHTKILDTYSIVENGGLSYFMADVGLPVWRHEPAGFTLSAFAGYHYWNEVVDAYGARCNSGGLLCPGGTQLVPFSTRVITNNATWHAMRIGLSADVEMSQRVSLHGTVAYLPFAKLYNEDSHHLEQTTLSGLPNPVPNLIHYGTGSGLQLEGAIDVRLTDAWSVGAGLRYWQASTDGTNENPNFSGSAIPLNEFSSERLGLFLQTSLRF